MLCRVQPNFNTEEPKRVNVQKVEQLKNENDDDGNPYIYALEEKWSEWFWYWGEICKQKPHRFWASRVITTSSPNKTTKQKYTHTKKGLLYL